MSKTKTSPVKRGPAHFIGIALALVIIGAYFLLPFVIQPERGPSTVAVVTESKKANELKIFKTGVELIPLAALGVLLLGAWNVIVPGASRAISFLMSVTGLLVVVYYINFFRDYAAGEATFISSMGSAFWIMLVAGILCVLQILIPRGISERRYRITKLFGNQESVILFGLLFLIFVVGIANPRFLQERNISDILQGNAYIAVAALGMTMVIVTGNIDISVGSLVGLLAVISGRLVVAGLPAPLAWLAPLIVGAGFGALIGFLVAYLRIPSIVVTLGMLSIIKGILIIWAQGERVRDMPADYFLSQMRPLGIPMPIIIMVALTIGRIVDALQRHRARLLRAGRQCGSSASLRLVTEATVDDCLHLERRIHRRRQRDVFDPIQYHSSYPAARARAFRHYGFSGRRREHPGRDRHGNWIDHGDALAEFHPFGDDLYQCIALLAKSRTRSINPGDGAGGFDPAPATAAIGAQIW